MAVLRAPVPNPDPDPDPNWKALLEEARINTRNLSQDLDDSRHQHEAAVKEMSMNHAADLAAKLAGKEQEALRREIELQSNHAETLLKKAPAHLPET